MLSSFKISSPGDLKVQNRSRIQKIVSRPTLREDHVCQVGMNGDTFSIKAPKESSKKFAATLKGNSFPEEMFLEHFFVLRKFWGASIEKVLPLKLLWVWWCWRTSLTPSLILRWDVSRRSGFWSALALCTRTHILAERSSCASQTAAPWGVSCSVWSVCSLLSYCFRSMLPGIDLHNGHSVIALKYCVSEEWFLAALREARVIIAWNNFWRRSAGH